MDVPHDDVTDLDGPLLAALWTRAVLAADPTMVARCEAEAANRGVRVQTLVAAACRPRTAAAPKKKDDEVLDPGKRSKGADSYEAIVNQAQKNIKEGKSYDTGQQTYKDSKGYNPYRKKKGEKGGGQFTTKDGAQTTDPEAARKGAELQEDDPSIPDKSPGGAKIDDFRDGMMIYEDGTRFDANGWRDAKGRALDSNGKVIKKSGSAGGDAKAVAREKAKTEKEAERARKKKEQEESHAWDTAESRRKADAAAAEGNYAPLLSIVERNETAARKARDLTHTPEGAIDAADRTKADQAVADAQKELADVKAAAAKAKEAKTVADKAAREKKAADAKTERETKAETGRVAEYAEIAKNYPVWEKELRDKYAEVGLSEAELAELVIRDRASRVRLLPRKHKPVTAAVGVYDASLHPKGKDGKWINKLGLVDVFGLSGFQHGQRGHKQVQGQVVEIVPNTHNPGDPIIRVKVTDPRWDPAKFGETVDVHRHQVAERAKPKAKLPAKPPPPDIAKPGVQQDITGGVPPARTPTPNLTPHPDGPHLAPLELPAEWKTMDNAQRVDWVEERMATDLTAWRGEDTMVDLTGFDAGIAFNLANTYRDLVNWDPETAKRIDIPLVGNQSIYHDGALGKNAIAVAHPGTAHPGGIGKKLGPAQIVFGNKYVTGMDFWQKQQIASAQSEVPWSTSSMTGDPTVTLIHEFGHQRQFRYLDIAMRDSGKAWSPTVRDDGFGLIPDSSNWPETQALRHDIPTLSQTKYGQSKSSEGFAEGISERALGISSPELDTAFDQWTAYMAVSLDLPADRHATSRAFDDLTPTEQDQFWQANGPYLDLPGMAAHYPDSVAAYETWKATKQGTAPTVVAVPASVHGPGGEIPLTTLSDDTGQFEPGGWANPETIASVQSGLDKIQARYPKAPPLRTIGIRPDQTALGNKSNDTITVSPAFHDPAMWEQKKKDAWLFAGDGTPAATIFHEYGHILDGALTSEQRQSLDAIVRQPVTYQVGGKDVTVPRWQSGDASLANPSAYASESPYEFVAEALTDVEFNGDQAAPISQEIAAVFTGVFG